MACIPTSGTAELEDAVYDHFGSAPYFTLYSSETEELTILENRNAHHDHGTCHPMNQLARHKIDCVICSGMGRRAIEALSTKGIKVYQCKSYGVREVIDRVKDGDLEEIDPRTACRGLGQRVDHMHGQCLHVHVGRGQNRAAGHGMRPGRRDQGGGFGGN